MEIHDNKFQRELEVAIAAAKASGKIMDDYLEGRIDVKDKKSSEVDIVTQADHDCQEKIVEIIKREFPEDGLVGEEDLNSGSENGRNWVIDPIDGTFNFKKGHEYFCTSVGLEIEGETKVGVVYSPSSGLGQMFYAVEGEGAFLREDGEDKPLETSGQETVEGSLLQLTLIKNHSNERWQTHSNLLEALRDKDSRYLKQGCLALSVCKVAEGSFDGVIEYGWQWDFSAARLILSEAGVSYRYRPESSDGLDEFVGSNGYLQKELVEMLDDSRA